MPNITAFIQARMSSSRLPGKVLKRIEGRTLIQHLSDRLKLCHSLNNVVLTTSTDPSDDEIEAECKRLGLECFRGSLDNVLDRFYQAALAYKVDILVRATADCPLLMPELVDRLVFTFLKDGPYDYLGYLLPYPEGLASVSMMPFKTLKYSWEHAAKPSEIEHPPIYVITRPEEFKLRRIIIDSTVNDLRFTIDEENDCQMMSKLMAHLYRPDRPISLWDVENFAYEHPEIVEMNKGTKRNEGFLKSLAADRAKAEAAFQTEEDVRLKGAHPKAGR
jgi:spore coat polysaccharide biosynthesis protein SpsF